MKVLELFCGTKSISKEFEKAGHETYTVDWNPEFNPTLQADISTLTKEIILDLCGGYPDVIWASPDCTSYSVAAISHHRRRESNGNLKAKSEYAGFCDITNSHVIDLILELNPKFWFIENPRGGMRKMNFVQSLPRYTVTYCQYNDPYVQELIFTMKNKKCPKCGLTKDIGEFYRSKSRRDGFTSWCKGCKEEYKHRARERKEVVKSVSDGTVTLDFELQLLEQQNFTCAYCGCDLTTSGKHLDHIVPLSRGGLHTANNVHWTCPTCNLSKNSKLEEEWLKKERMKPTDLWTNHANPQFKPMCKNGDPCHEAAPRGSSTGTQGLKGAKEKARIPELLARHIVEICEDPKLPTETSAVGWIQGKLF